MVRVISGSSRGTQLFCQEGLLTRPTLDRVKEALFSILTPYIPAMRVLDAFAGSGALGIEALSRGSGECVFIDASVAAVDIVKRNLEKTHLLSEAQVICADTLETLKSFSAPFDLIFLDPPYASSLMHNSLCIIEEKALLAKDGVIVLEWDKERPTIPRAFEIIKEKRYGRVNITLVR